jgi:hypothetical protein
MLDLKVYLHRKKVKLEPYLYLLAGSCFLTKAYLLSPEPFNFWFGLNIFLGVLLLGFMLLQLVTRFNYPKLAAYFNSRIGFMLVVASLLKLYGEVTEMHFFFLGVGLLFMFTNTLEESLQKIPFLTIDDEGILVRYSLLTTVCYSWHEISDLDIKRARVKFTLQNGETLYLRVAREYTDSCMLRTAQYYGEKLFQITRRPALMAA